MSNMIGALLIGSTMIGADPDQSSSRNLQGTVEGGTQITARLYVSMRPRSTVVGGTVIIADLQFRSLSRVRLAGDVTGGTVIIYKAPVRREIVLVGEVGAANDVALLRHGHVHAADLARSARRVDVDQRVLSRTPYYV